MGVSPVEAARLIETLRAVLLRAAADRFAGIDTMPDLGTRLRAVCDRLLETRGALPPERVGPVTAWRKGLGRFEKLLRDEQEIEIAHGLRLCVAIAGRMT